MNDFYVGEVAIIILFIVALYGFGDILIHISCLIARVTKKKVCHCWDCQKKCELYEHSEPEPGLDLDNKLYYFCGYCGHNICATSENNNTIKKFHTYCGHCGNKVNWSQLDEREWYMKKDVKSFGKGRTLTTMYKFMKRKDKKENE